MTEVGMNTQLVAKNLKLQHWTGVIQECHSSGLSVKDWIKEHDIPKDTYYYWQRKVREAAVDAINPQFTRVDMTGMTRTPGSVFAAELELTAGNTRISVNSDTPRELLRMVLEEISHAE